MQRGNILVYLLIGVVILVGVAGGAYYLGQKNTYRSPLTSQSTETSKSTLPADETKDWVIYKDDQYGFEIKYPSQSSITTYPSDIKELPELISTVYIDLKNSTEDVQSPPPQTIRVWSNLGVVVTDISSRKKWCDELSKKFNESTGQLECVQNGNFGEITFNSYKAFKNSNGRDNSMEDLIFIPHGNYVYQLEVSRAIVSSDGKGDYVTSKDPTVDKVFSTFKFTN